MNLRIAQNKISLLMHYNTSMLQLQFKQLVSTWLNNNAVSKNEGNQNNLINIRRSVLLRSISC